MTQANILIVDDSAFDRQIMARALRQQDGPDIVLSEAGSALEAVSQIEATAFDAVFLDINMPGENGFYVLRAIRTRENGTWPLVFMLSSSNHPDDISQAYGAYATAYIQKPDDMAHVRSMARNCLNLLTDVSAP